MLTREVAEYTLEDMSALEDMSYDDAMQYLEQLDRGYFNQFVLLDRENEFRTYSEEEYCIYALRIALYKAENALHIMAMLSE